MASLRSVVCVTARADCRRLSQLRRVGVMTSLNQEQLCERHNFCPGPSAPRHYHTSPLSLSRKQLATLEGAHEFLSSLSPAQRSNLSSALQKIRSLPERGVLCVKHMILHLLGKPCASIQNTSVTWFLGQECIFEWQIVFFLPQNLSLHHGSS